MERLTIPDVKIDEKTTKRVIVDGDAVRACAMEFYWRLKKIEDILGDDYDLDRLRELVEADRDGRCVVLPCKDWLEFVFGEQEVFFALDDSYEEEQIREITVRNENRFTWYNGWETVVFNGTDENGLDYEFYPSDIGDTVFLTREAAEVALKGEAHE